MQVKKIKKILEKSAEGMSDEELLELESVAGMLANIAIDQWQKMSPDEKEKWREKIGKR